MLDTMRPGLPAPHQPCSRQRPEHPIPRHPYRQPISWLEHFLHLNLTVITSGLWGFVWYRRAQKGREFGPEDLICHRCEGTGFRWATHGLNRVMVECTH